MQADQVKGVAEEARKTATWADRNPRAFGLLIAAICIYGTWMTMNARDKDKDREIERISKERDEFKRERDEYKYYILPKLRELQPTIEATAQKIDSITQK
ncbi:MAG: hypothetical protein J7599_07455 [Niabella sp.]|nr:hypothetical protein [Niabella sp.]